MEITLRNLDTYEERTINVLEYDYEEFWEEIYKPLSNDCNSDVIVVDEEHDYGDYFRARDMDLEWLWDLAHHLKDQEDEEGKAEALLVFLDLYSYDLKDIKRHDEKIAYLEEKYEDYPPYIVYDKEDFAIQMFDETTSCGSCDISQWPFTCINWKDAAHDLSMDYHDVGFKDFEVWIANH